MLTEGKVAVVVWLLSIALCLVFWPFGIPLEHQTMFHWFISLLGTINIMLFVIIVGGTFMAFVEELLGVHYESKF